MTRGRPPVVVLALAIVLAVLGGRFAVHMAQLARKGDHRDFAAVYTAAHVWRAGGRFYDTQPLHTGVGANGNPELIAAARRLGTLHAHEGFVHVHVFSYPPFAVLPFLPFTALSFPHAAVLWQALSVAFAAVAGWCLWRAVPLGAASGLTLAGIALLYEPLENSLGLGQINLLVLALTAVFVWALAAGRPVAAGLAIGLAAALRLHPALFIAYLAWRRQWRAFAWGAGTAVACTLAAIPLVGWSATLEYVTDVAPRYARSFAGLGGHSLPAFILTTGPAFVAGVPEPVWRGLGRALSVAALAAAVLILTPGGAAARPRLVRETAFLSTVLLLAVPNTTINHLVFTFIPLAVLLAAALDGRGEEWRWLPWLALSVLLLGGVDDYYGHPRLAGGPQVLLAGIKTYALVILAVLGARLVRRPPEPAYPQGGPA
jgi:alpha-1,2-mannosyltransferase